MIDEDKTKEQRTGEMVQLDQQVVGLKTAETKRKQVRGALLGSEQQFRALIENAQDAIVILNPDATIRYQSPAMERMTGRKAKDRIDKNPLEFCYPDDTASVAEAFIQLLENKIAIAHTELRLQHKNGRWLTFEVIGTNMIDNPAVAGIVLNLRDITERKRVEEALRESEERYRDLFDSVIDGVVVIDGETMKIVLANQTALKMYGFHSAEDITELNLLDYVHPDDRERAVRIIVEDMFEKDLRQVNEFRTITKDGQEKCFSAIGTKIEYQGKPAGLVSFRDITERKQVGEAMHKSQDKLRAVFESIGDAVTVSDLEGRIIEENEAALRMQGYSHKKEVIGQSGLELVAEKDRARVIEAISNALKLGYGPLGEFTFIDKNGRESCGEASAALLRDSSGNPEGFISVIRDITERKRVEEALQESEERFRSLVKNAPYMIIIADREGKILLINYTTSGFSVEDTIGTSIYDYISVEYHDEVSRSINGIFKSGEPAAYEITGAGPDGTTSWYSVRLGPIKRDGHIIAVTLMALDITERKRVEEAMRESQEKLRILFDSIGVGITVTDLAGNIVDVNETILHMKGFSREDVIGRYGLDFVAERDRARAADAMMDFLKGQEEKTPTWEFALLTKDGSEIPCEASATLLRDSSGNIVGFISIERDITERKRAEKALRESEDRYRTLVETMNDGLAAQDIDGIFTYVNDRLCEMLGFSRDELIGVHLVDLLDEVSRNKYKEEMSSRHTGKHVPYEIEFTRKDGAKIITRISPQLITDQEGNMVGSFGVATDITDLKRAEEELRESEERLRNFMESATDVYTIWNSKLELLDVSERGTKAFLPTATREDMIGKHITEIVPDVKKTGRYYEYLNVIKTGQPFQVEDTVVHPKFGIRNVSIKAFKVRDGLGLVLADITERKKAEEELRHYSERLRVMATQLSAAEDNERRRLARELHDRVGQNLTALSINLSMVRTQLPEEAVAPVSSTLDDSQSILEQTAAIIRDVMSNLQPPVMEEYGLVAALRWYADRFASRTGISVTVQGEDPIPRLNTSSENTLFRIIQETLTNVAKHAQATQVTVNSVVESKTVRLVVTDDGVGFNVADVVHSDVQQGWGLTTMSERAKSLGGSFDIESRPGHGTRVVVEIGR